MTYNNPVYIDQCKLRKIEIDDSGFVEQIPLDKKEKLIVEEIDDEDEDDIDEDDDMDEDDDFDEKNFKRPPSKLSKPSIPSKSPKSTRNSLIEEDDFDEDDDSDENSEISLKIKGSKTNLNKKPTITPIAPPLMTDDDLEELFGHKTESKPSVRNRVEKELKDVKPNIKLNIDNSSSDGTNQSNAKPKIKLNIKPKQ